MYVQQPQATFAGGQGGVVIIQPNSAVTTTTRGYPVGAQPPMHFPQQVSFFINRSLIVIVKLCENCLQLTSRTLSIGLSDTPFLEKYRLRSFANDCLTIQLTVVTKIKVRRSYYM